MTDTQPEDAILNRAFAAYYRGATRPGGPARIDQPGNLSHIAEAGGKQYVVLRNIDEVLAVYRIRVPSGALKELKRWPKELDVEP